MISLLTLIKNDTWIYHLRSLCVLKIFITGKKGLKKSVSKALMSISLVENCSVFLVCFIIFYLFIYFWLRWVFTAARGLSLVAASGGYTSLWCAGFSLRWLLLLQSTGSRRTGFSSCGSRALERRLSSCGTRA